MAGGYGFGWGHVPWGGSLLSSIGPPSDFDIYCFFDSLSSMGSILSAPGVSTVDAGGQFLIDGSDNDLLIRSGGIVSTDDAQLNISAVIPDTWTLEFTLKISAIPSDFTDLVNRHIFIGATSGTGACAGVFISALGVAYAGGIHHVAGNLQLDSTLQILPGSNGYIELDRYIVFRLAADDTTKTLYLYVTNQDQLPMTGHVLRAVLPVIDAADLAFTPSDLSVVSVRGTALQPTYISLDEDCMSTHLLIPNLAPVADAGIDKSVQYCEVLKFDGSGSFDPEGANLLYHWELIDAPQTSIYVVADSDGQTTPIDLTGFTNKFYSIELGVLFDPVVVDDVLLFNGISNAITAIGTDGSGYYLQIATQTLPDSLSGVPFRVLRQRGIYQPDTVTPTFLPDVAGFYRFQLVVSDGQLPSEPAIVVFNILESLLPRGVVPDVSFLFGLMSDFWTLVEGRDRITTLWSGLAQVAAAELLTLWQHDYAKSLRDIQRQFTRKWLHYDLLLPEPIPELTGVRAVWGGLYSAATTVADTSGYNIANSSITLFSPIWTAPKTVTFGYTPLSPDIYALADQMNNYLKTMDPRFTVRVAVWANGAAAVHIYAPFAFQVVDSTLELFTSFTDSTSILPFPLGSVSSQPGGAPGTDNQSSRAGVAVGSNIYRVYSRVDLMGVVENDFLCIDGVAYRILTMTPDLGGSEQVDIVVKETLPTVPSNTWMIASYVTSELLNFWDGLTSAGDQAFLEIAQVDDTAPTTALAYQLYRVQVVGSNETANTSLPVDLGFLPVDLAASTSTVRLARVLRRQYVPISPLVLDVPTLSASILVQTQAEEEAVLRRNVDFTLESVRNGSAIKFVSGVIDPSLDVWEQLDPPSRLWAEFTYLDNRPTIEQNFGIPVLFTLDDLNNLLPLELDYLSAVRGLWYAYFNGPTLNNLRIGTQILLGLPFAEETGTIEEIRADFSPTLGRLLIRDTANAAIVRSYSYPRALSLEVNPATAVPYVVGDTVQQFSPLVKGADIVDYVKDPRWFSGLLAQGIFNEVEKYFKFLVKIDSAAFNLSAVLAVKDFVLRIKPTYTYPLLVVESGGGGGGSDSRSDDINISDLINENVTVNLVDTICDGRFGSSPVFDNYRGDGTVANQFDADSDPTSPPPTFPTSDTPILWAFDKQLICPDDSVIVEVATRFASAEPILVGQCFLVGEPYTMFMRFKQNNYSVTTTLSADPNDPAAGVAPISGNLSHIKFRSKGLFSGSSLSLSITLLVNGTPVITALIFLEKPGGEVVVPLTSISVATGNTVAVTVAASGSIGPLDFIEATVYYEDTASWSVGETLTGASYLTTRVLA